MGAGPSDFCIEWDAENRLTRVLNGGTEVVRYRYDGKGQRVEKTVGGTTTSFVLDGAEVLEERTGVNTTRYVHGPSVDQHWARQDPGGAVSYYVADHLGSIVQTTNASATVTLTREYDPWGTMLQGSSTSGYAYTGREWDAETGLYYYRARYYDPKIGRLLSEDPIEFKGGINFYTYVGSNPTSVVDPYGLQSTRFGDDWGVPPQPPPRTCWQLNFDGSVTCSPTPRTPPTCTQDRTCTSVPDPCPPQWRCWIDWGIFWSCMLSGNAAPGPSPRQNPPTPPDGPGTRGSSAAGSGASAGRLPLSWANGCMIKARRCGYVPGSCAAVYCK
jgi:RHS repeat-associated protein